MNVSQAESDDGSGSTSDSTMLIRALVTLLNSVTPLLEQMPGPLYSTKGVIPGSNSIGAHIRHIYDHLDMLIAGVPEGVVDYDARRRDPRIEVDPQYAVQRIVEGVYSLESLWVTTSSTEPLAVRAQTSESSEAVRVRVSTTLERECLYLWQHTIHHFSVISMLARAAGVPVPEGLGVTPATLSFMKGSSTAP